MKCISQTFATHLRSLWSSWGMLYSGILLIALVFVAVTASVMLDEYRKLRRGPTADVQQVQVENELKEITAPSGTLIVRHSSTHKSDHGAVSNVYKTDLAYDDIRAFYDAAMSRQGWRFVKEDRSLFNRRDYGGMHAFYCKGSYSADLEYAGQLASDFGWTYSVAITWGLNGPCK